MSCFSNICRICLRPLGNGFFNLKSNDTDATKMLLFCIPEMSNQHHLPEQICKKCHNFLSRMQSFKEMTLQNTSKLNMHTSPIISSSSSTHNAKTPTAINRFSSDTDVDGPASYSVSLNQWDLFESQISCRCIPTFNSITEPTEHLHNNCEGDLLGIGLFQIIENKENKLEPLLGFDYCDIALAKVHMNCLQKQIKNLEQYTSEYNSILNTSREVPARTISYEQNTFKIQSENLECKRCFCDKCDKSYTKRYRLKLHLQKHHPEFPIRRCLYCSKEFLFDTDKEKHMLRHQNDRKFKKKQIKTEKTSPKRKHHEGKVSSKPIVDDKLKSKDINLNCATCDKSFTDKAKFGIHLVTHVGRKYYKCRDCKKKFLRKENLNLHMLAH